MTVDLSLFPKVTLILRGYSVDQADNILNILSKSGIKAVEIALQDKNSKKVLERLIDRYGDKMVIGAGTVLTRDDLLEVIKIGVKFVLSPVFNQEIVEIGKQNGVICIPGAFSPSEIYNSWHCGADIVKVFPASVLTPKFFKAVKAPLPSIKLMAVGGVNEKNAAEFLSNGADYVGIGSGIFNREKIQKGDYEAIRQKLSELENSLKVQS